MRIGIYAGTFDPAHVGHIAFAEQAVNEANLDKVVIVAEKEPYRKKPHASWDHRQAMIERATENLAVVDHDYQFAAQLAHKHTLQDMLSVAKKHYGSGNEFWFLVGSDVFQHLNKWHDVVANHEYGGFVIALRDDHTPSWVFEKASHMKLDHTQMRLVDNEHPHISSSAIRSAIAKGVAPDHLPPAVERYIIDHQLYALDA